MTAKAAKQEVRDTYGKFVLKDKQDYGDRLVSSQFLLFGSALEEKSKARSLVRHEKSMPK